MTYPNITPISNAILTQPYARTCLAIVTVQRNARSRSLHISWFCTSEEVFTWVVGGIAVTGSCEHRVLQPYPISRRVIQQAHHPDVREAKSILSDPAPGPAKPTQARIGSGDRDESRNGLGTRDQERGLGRRTHPGRWNAGPGALQ